MSGTDKFIGIPVTKQYKFTNGTGKPVMVTYPCNLCYGKRSGATEPICPKCGDSGIIREMIK